VISASATELIAIGGLVVVASFLIRPDPQRLDTVFGKIWFGLIRVLRMAGFAAITAALIILVVPLFKPADLTNENLTQLNERIEQYHRWLEMSWVVLMALIVSLLSCVWFGWVEVSAAKAKIAGHAIKAASTAKMLVGFLACFTFVGAGLSGRVEERKSEAETAQAKLETLQAMIFSQEKRVVERDLVADTVHETSSQSAYFQQTVTAYSIASPFIPDRPPDVDRSDNVVEPKQGQDAKSASEHGIIPDISLARAENLETELNSRPKDDTPQAILVEDMVHLAFDKGVSDQMKTYLFHIGNPLISEFASAVLDPLFSEPAENFVSAQASKIMSGHFNQRESQEQVRQASQYLSKSVSTRIAKVGHPANTEGAPLGDPRWNIVRTKMRLAVSIGLPRKTASVQNDARAMMDRFDKMWRSLNLVVVESGEREQVPEKVFSEYMKKNPDFAALWGYAVIAFTPDEYGSDLEETATRKGPPPEMLKDLKRLVRMSAQGDITAQQAMDKFDPEHKLTPASADLDYGQVWFEYHGPYPLDGYLLYQKEIHDQSTEEAVNYFSSESVNKFVDTYCPSSQ
jgi:hypothetical protein